MVLRKTEKINLQRYMGKWFEIAKKPFIFQRNCSNAIARYSLNKDQNVIFVMNLCKTRSGRIKKVTGKAIPTSQPNVLKLSFGIIGPKSDYIIEFVDETYSYAIIGTRSKKYLWILARKAHINKETFLQLVKIAQRKGYDVSNISISRRLKE